MEAFKHLFCLRIILSKTENIAPTTASAELEIVGIGIQTFFPSVVDTVGYHRFKVVVCPDGELPKVFKERIHILFQKRLYAGIIVSYKLFLQGFSETFGLHFLKKDLNHRSCFSNHSRIDEEDCPPALLLFWDGDFIYILAVFDKDRQVHIADEWVYTRTLTVEIAFQKSKDLFEFL